MSQEEINNEVQIRLAVHDEKFNSFTREMQSFKEEMQTFRDEMRDFKNEMRKQNEMRANEITEMRQAFQSLHAQNIGVIVGVIAIAVAVFLK